MPGIAIKGWPGVRPEVHSSAAWYSVKGRRAALFSSPFSKSRRFDFSERSSALLALAHEDCLESWSTPTFVCSLPRAELCAGFSPPGLP